MALKFRLRRRFPPESAMARVGMTVIVKPIDAEYWRQLGKGHPGGTNSTTVVAALPGSSERNAPRCARHPPPAWESGIARSLDLGGAVAVVASSRPMPPRSQATAGARRRARAERTADVSLAQLRAIASAADSSADGCAHICPQSWWWICV